MRTFPVAVALLAFALAGPTPAFAAGVEVIEVSPGGDVLQDALVRAGELRVKDGVDGVSVVLSGGDYLLTEPLRAEALGREGVPVEIVAKPDETPVIHGGVRVTGWREEGGHWVADFPAALPAGADLSALWVNGRRATPARTPNAANEAGDFPADSDFFYTAGPVMVKTADGKEDKSATAFQYGEGDLQAWPGLDEAVFVVFHSWETSLHRVERLDTEKREVHFKKAAVWPFTRWLPKQWYFVENLMEGLDQPGECVISPKTGKIHYLPRPGETLDTVDAWVPVAKQLLVLADGAGPVAGVTLRGLRFEHTGWGVGPE
ncbi:MAG TPA: hypothetical protein P5069_18380, partial [Candidatus Hydrogenedentes bacterium]|nr:hypothetical protein [Candidatus Hydrogenedentota bacterium]